MIVVPPRSMEYLKRYTPSIKGGIITEETNVKIVRGYIAVVITFPQCISAIDVRTGPYSFETKNVLYVKESCGFTYDFDINSETVEDAIKRVKENYKYSKEFNEIIKSHPGRKYVVDICQIHKYDTKMETYKRIEFY